MTEKIFNSDEQQRYARHFALPEIGEEGQLRLRHGRVLVVGAGGLGSPVLLYLAAAGVGTIGIIDGDNVDFSNLQRQIIHTTADIDRPKAISAKEKLLRLNPNIHVTAYTQFLTDDNADEILPNYDFVIDATDNLGTKYLINDLCVNVGKPYSHGAISHYSGHTMTILPGTACYRCLIPDATPSDEPTAGPLGAIPGILGTLQAVEALKYLTGIGSLLTNRLLTFDALAMSFHSLSLSPNSDCRCRKASKI